MHADDKVKIARAALLLAGLEPRKRSDALEIKGKRMSFEGAARLLAASVKPLQLEINHGATGHPSLNMAAADDVTSLKLWRDASPISFGLEHAQVGQSILIVGENRTVRLTGKQLKRLLLDYYCPKPLSLSGDFPSKQQARRGGIGWVIQVHRHGQQVNLSDLDAEDPLSAAILEAFGLRGHND